VPLAPGEDKEDELYEMYMNEVNFVYVLSNDNRMVLSTEHTSKPLKHDMLRSTQVCSFNDFLFKMR